MTSSARIFAAMAASLLAHFILVIWPVAHNRIEPPNKDALLQIMPPLSLHLNHVTPAMPKSVAVAVAAAVKAPPEKPPITASHDAPKFIAPPVQPESVPDQAEEVHNSGHFRWRPPAANQDFDNMLAQHQAQLANQRAAQAVAILSGMSESSLKLAQVLTATMTCRQQDDLDIACTPEPPENTLSLLTQFFSVAVQAHDMKLTGNSVQVELGESQRLTLELRVSLR